MHFKIQKLPYNYFQIDVKYFSPKLKSRFDFSLTYAWIFLEDLHSEQNFVLLVMSEAGSLNLDLKLSLTYARIIYQDLYFRFEDLEVVLICYLF